MEIVNSILINNPSDAISASNIYLKVEKNLKPVQTSNIGHNRYIILLRLERSSTNLIFVVEF